LNNPSKPVLGLILKGYPRISETFISNEILLLEQLGFSIHLFSMRQPRENFSHASVKGIKAKVDYLPETLLIPLPRFLYYNFRLAAKQPRRYLSTVKSAVRRFRRTRRLATFKHLLQAGYLVEHLLPGSGVSHLHAHFAHSPTSVALFACQLIGIPYSFTAHAKDIYTSHSEQLHEKIVQARFVVTCTEYNKQRLAEISRGAGVPLFRIYHGIDTDLFNGTIEQKVPSPPFNILTVARLTAKKGLPTVYRALRRLHDQGVLFRHTLIGNGEDRKKILALINDLGLGPLTSWLGTQPHGVVMEHYRRADLFVLGCEVAANGDRDGIPNVFLECMAMGVPIVATRVSAIPELLADRETGLLVPPRAPEDMARAMSRLLSDLELRRQIVASARRHVRHNFNNKVLINALAGLFKAQGL